MKRWMRIKEESEGFYRVCIEGIIVGEARRELRQWKVD